MEDQLFQSKITPVILKAINIHLAVTGKTKKEFLEDAAENLISPETIEQAKTAVATE